MAGSDLTKIINLDYLTEDIDTFYEKSREERNYLGLSACGHKCQRLLWYVYNNYPQSSIPGQILRLFKLGDLIEEQLRDDFMKAGYSMASDQKEVFFEYKGLILKGHIDGIIMGLKESDDPHLWECKTSNDKRFKQLVKLNSYQKWDEKYYFQIQAYMLGLGLTRALVTVYNKNDSSLYQERIKLDKDFIVKKLQTVFETIGSKKLPVRSCPRSDWWEAKWCSFQESCWEKYEI